ncbi:MAG: hypothetical protein [Arizlama microvirus]|nr:MAG: hypothetical protein [Arizlama microvirus]
MEFQSTYSEKKRKPEKNSGEIKVEVTGYIDSETRITNLILAGQRLEQSRKEQYDFPDYKSIDDDFTDPTRARNFDLAEASQLQYSTELKLKDIEFKQKADRELKASQTAQE